MKLYATVISDRAEKGQGGNKKITVAFRIENGAKNYEVLALAELTHGKYPDGERYYLQLIDCRDNTLVGQLSQKIEAKKGNKEKDERYCEQHPNTLLKVIDGRWYCSNCAQ